MKILESNEDEIMKQHRFFRTLKILLIVVVAGTLLGFVIMHLWNWLMPSLFGLNVITFWQALGLFVLGKLLLGGFHRHHGGPPRRGQPMRERWGEMGSEERKRFPARKRGRSRVGVVSPARPD